jgi:hypothetical protein
VVSTQSTTRYPSNFFFFFFFFKDIIWVKFAANKCADQGQCGA